MTSGKGGESANKSTTGVRGVANERYAYAQASRRREQKGAFSKRVPPQVFHVVHKGRNHHHLFSFVEIFSVPNDPVFFPASQNFFFDKGG